MARAFALPRPLPGPARRGLQRRLRGDELQQGGGRPLHQAEIDYYLHFAEIGKDEDQRNYEVSYAKIRGKGFKTEIDMETGIDELIRAVDLIGMKNAYGNV